MTEDRAIVVIGSGGHAKVVVDTIQAAGMHVPVVYDDDAARWNQTLSGVPIVGPVDQIQDSEYSLAVVAVGDAQTRKRLVDRLDVDWATIVHPDAYVAPSAKLGRGTVVFAGAVVQPDAQIGEHAIINTGANVDHDCRLGDFVQVAPGAHLSGCVTVDEGTFLGTGASVIEQIEIGKWSTIGAGAVIIRDVPDSVIAVGCPAKVVAKGFPQRRVDDRVRRPIEIIEADAAELSTADRVRESVAEVINGRLADSDRPQRTFSDDDALRDDLGLDSLDLAATIVGLEQALGVDPFRQGVRPVRTFGELVDLYTKALDDQA